MKYLPTIGIECHVQLKTKTKLFSAVDNDAREAKPNTLISHIDAGLPGALPVLNKAAIELSVRAAFALNTRPQKNSYFERKHYFYPDSPAGYQISQLHAPIIVGGSVYIEIDGQKKSIAIDRVQLEADAGKNTHPAGADYSLVDLNRAGTPLLEIVSEPQIQRAKEAKAYARELWLIMKYAGVTEGDLYQGQVRFDVNVSLSDKTAKLGIRTETKNLNSFRAVEAAIEYEIERQNKLLENGEKVIQETRGWDEDKQITTAQRGKEEAHDYRYMPEPDIPPVELNDAFVSNIESQMPKMPSEWRSILSEKGFDDQTIETILDKGADDDVYLRRLNEYINHDPEFAKFVVKFQLNDLPALEKSILRQTSTSLIDGAGSTRSELSLEQYKTVYKLVKEGRLNSSKARNLIFDLMGMTPDTDIEEHAVKHDYIQVSDKGEIEKIVAEVLAENTKAAEDVRNGEMKAIGFLVGQVMAKSKGKANPALAQQNIKEQLSI